MPCLPQHFKYYVRVWLSVPEHSHFFPSWFQLSSVPRDLSQARNGSQAALPVCPVDSDKYRVILLFSKAATSLAPTQLGLQAKQLKIPISLRRTHIKIFNIFKVNKFYSVCHNFWAFAVKKSYVVFFTSLCGRGLFLNKYLTFVRMT